MVQLEILLAKCSDSQQVDEEFVYILNYIKKLSIDV